jgi:hypothetical protein
MDARQRRSLPIVREFCDSNRRTDESSDASLTDRGPVNLGDRARWLDGGELREQLLRGAADAQLHAELRELVPALDNAER